jgi:hypothetical protein
MSNKSLSWVEIPERLIWYKNILNIHFPNLPYLTEVKEFEKNIYANMDKLVLLKIENQYKKYIYDLYPKSTISANITLVDFISVLQHCSKNGEVIKKTSHPMCYHDKNFIHVIPKSLLKYVNFLNN